MYVGSKGHYFANKFLDELRCGKNAIVDLCIRVDPTVKHKLFFVQVSHDLPYFVDNF